MCEEAELYHRASEVETERRTEPKPPRTVLPWYETLISRLRDDLKEAWGQHATTRHRETVTWTELYRLLEDLDLPPMDVDHRLCGIPEHFLEALERRIEKRLSEERSHANQGTD